MSTSTYVPVTCSGCGRPINESTFIWNGVGMYHNHCAPPASYTLPPFGGQPLTEERVREIVREELARATSPTQSRQSKT